MNKEDILEIGVDERSLGQVLPGMAGVKLDIVSMDVGQFRREKERLGIIEAEINTIEANETDDCCYLIAELAIKAVMERDDAQDASEYEPFGDSQSDKETDLLIEQEIPPGPRVYRSEKRIEIAISKEAGTEFPAIGSDIRIVHIHPYWIDEHLKVDVVLAVDPIQNSLAWGHQDEEWDEETLWLEGGEFIAEGEPIATAWRVESGNGDGSSEIVAQIIVDTGEHSPLKNLEAKLPLVNRKIYLGRPRLELGGGQWGLTGLARVNKRSIQGEDENMDTRHEERSAGSTESSSRRNSPYADAFLSINFPWSTKEAEADTGNEELTGKAAMEKDDFAHDFEDMQALEDNTEIQYEATDLDNDMESQNDEESQIDEELVTAEESDVVELAAADEESQMDEEAMTDEESQSDEELAADEKARLDEGSVTDEEFAVMGVRQNEETHQNVEHGVEEDLPAVLQVSAAVSEDEAEAMDAQGLGTRPMVIPDTIIPLTGSAQPLLEQGIEQQSPNLPWRRGVRRLAQAGTTVETSGPPSQEASKGIETGARRIPRPVEPTANANNTRRRGWKVIVVSPGETIGSIARKNGVTEEAIRSLNDLNPGDGIETGQTLMIPREAM